MLHMHSEMGRRSGVQKDYCKDYPGSAHRGRGYCTTIIDCMIWLARGATASEFEEILGEDALLSFNKNVYPCMCASDSPRLRSSSAPTPKPTSRRLSIPRLDRLFGFAVFFPNDMEHPPDRVSCPAHQTVSTPDHVVNLATCPLLHAIESNPLTRLLAQAEFAVASQSHRYHAFSTLRPAELDALRSTKCPGHESRSTVCHSAVLLHTTHSTIFRVDT